MPMSSKEKKQRYSDKWRDAGYVQIAFWIPKSETDAVRSAVKEIKSEYIRRHESGAGEPSDDG